MKIRRFGSALAFVCAAGAFLPSSSHAVDYYNLTTASSSTFPGITYQALDGMTYTGIFTNPSNDVIVGTGVIDPFIRIQRQAPGSCNQKGDPPCTERAYNTDGAEGKGVGKSQFDAHDNEGTNWNHSLLLSDIAITEIDGIKYRDFILDINEDKEGEGRFLSLDKFKLYLGSVGTLDEFEETNYTLGDGMGNLATKIYDMDSTGKDASIGMDYSINSGSGKGVDLVARIPDAFFKDKDGNYVAPYVYLYSSFGEVGTNTNSSDAKCKTHTCTTALPTGDFGHSAGFEEWATKKSTANPEPGSLLLLALGAGILGFLRRRPARPSSARSA